MYSVAPATLLAAFRRGGERLADRHRGRHSWWTVAFGLTVLVSGMMTTGVGVGVVLLGGSVPIPFAAEDTACQATPAADMVPASSGFTLPMEPGSYRVSSGFGPRDGEMHRGIDYAAPEGTAIFAAAAGTVVEAGPAGGFGQWIVVDHQVDGQLVSTVYGHMWPGGVGVSEGEQVQAGQPIAQVGSNGISTGPHLHFEVWEGGRLAGGNAVDPEPMLSAPKPPPEPTQPTVQPALTAPTQAQLLPDGVPGSQRALDLDPRQRAYVDSIVGVGKGMGLPPRAWVISTATALQESTLLNYANAKDSASLGIPHDAVGSDHDSVGLFQQRPSWGSLEERMDPATSARLFYEAMIDVPGWESAPLTEIAQRVQRSAFPAAYAKWEVAAADAVLASHGAPPIGDAAPVDPCAGGPRLV